MNKALLDSGWRNVARKNLANTTLAYPLLPEARSKATLVDFSGNQKNGTITGANLITPPGAPAYLSFDATDDKVTVNDGDLLDITTEDFTIVAWCNPLSNQSGARFLMRANGPWTSGWTFHTDGTPALNVRFNQAAGNTTQLSNASPMTLNKWNLIGFSRSGTSAIIYVNGANVNSGSTAMTNPVSYASGTIEIGNSDTFVAKYMTWERFIKNTALSAAQWADLWSRERRLFGR